MNLYTSFLIFNLIITVFSKNIDIISSLEDPIPKSIGLKFITKIDNIRDEDCSVDIFPDECCLDNDVKCDVAEIIGEANDVVGRGTTKTYILVAPLLNPYERKGYCTFYIDSRTVSNPKNIIRDTVKIKFNTKLKRETLPDDVSLCKHVDEDPLNNCRPVDCDAYYNGKKSYFHVTKQRCVAIPTCMPRYIDFTKIPKVSYNPVSNKCVGNRNIFKEDLDYLKELENNEKERIAYNKVFKNTLNLLRNPVNETTRHKNTSNIQTQNTILDKTSLKQEIAKAKDVLANKNKGVSEKGKQHNNQYKGDDTTKANKKCNSWKMKVVFGQKVTTTILGCIFCIQCCFICTMVYCLCKTCECGHKKKVVKNFFNYRQDVSVTTPLIGTSNIDTGTTDFQYVSESSNYIDKKIKCYKACQKERKNNMKISMSDDILSKCINRRDWLRMPRSQTIPEVRTDDELKIKEKKGSRPDRKGTSKQISHVECQDRPNRSIIKKYNTSKTIVAQQSESTEKEICCHSYNYDNESINIGSLNRNSHVQTYSIYNHEEQKADSIEKSAQAYFSNDSIDDFLSEKGVLFIGDNTSKYSYTSLSSDAKSSSSRQSSKTSKNNIVNSVMHLLTKKSKGPSSEPGTKKSGADIDLKLLHLSKASFSSSNDTDGKDIKRLKDSTSSL